MTTPKPPFPEMRLPAPVPGPPMVLFDPLGLPELFTKVIVTPWRALAEFVASRSISSNEVTLNQVARCRGVREIDSIQAVAGDHIPRGRRWAADRIVRGKNVHA